jgi:integrating conjugative element protein (TIGR03746 family)
MTIRSPIQARDYHIFTLRLALVCVTLLCIIILAIFARQQNRFIVQIPPDLSKGAMIKPGELLPSGSYVFAHYMWRTLNDWPANGKNDYKANIMANECYASPAFKRWLLDNYETKAKDGELDRTRYTQITRVYAPEFVKRSPPDGFVVELQMRIVERLNNEVIKTTEIIYPLRVIPDNRACNNMGMSLDGFYAQPRRVDLDTEKK